MGTTENKCITTTYRPYTIGDGKRDLVKEITTEHPFQFISGLGTTPEAFKSQIANPNKGDRFEFTIPFTRAYGEYNEEYVVDLPRDIFKIDEKFNNEHIYLGDIIPLMSSEDQHLNDSVVEIKADTVIMGINRPLAGEDLTFVGEVIEGRPVTDKEIQEMVKMMTGGGGYSCGSCGDNCSGDCGDSRRNDYNCRHRH